MAFAAVEAMQQPLLAASAHAPSSFPHARELELDAGWSDLLPIEFPQWSGTWREWVVTTPGGTPPWLLTAVVEGERSWHVTHAALPHRAAWDQWVHNFSADDFKLAVPSLLELSVRGYWEQASELPKLVRSAALGPLTRGFWDALLRFSMDGLDPKTAVVAACRL